MLAGTIAEAPLPPSALGRGEPVHVSWHQPHGLWALSFINFVLRVLTLGIYNFWGKTEMRARLWSGVRLNGEPIAYLGSGYELFLGFMVAMLYIVVPYGTLIGTQLTMGTKSAVAGAVGVLFGIVISWMWAVAFYRARRYRLTRTSWRGIQGNLVGSAHAYAWTYLWTMFVVGLTLGLAHPWRQTKLQRMLVENTRLGDAPLTFTATSWRLFVPFGLMWFVGAVVLGALGTAVGLAVKHYTTKQLPGAPLPAELMQQIGLIMLVSLLGGLIFWLAGTWYAVRSFNHYSTHTHVSGAHFAGTASAPGLMWVGFSNTLLAMIPVVAFTLLAIAVFKLVGLAMPESSAPGAAPGTPAPWVIQVGVLIALFCFSLFSPIMGARTARFWVRNLKLEGHIALETVRPALGQSTKLGEGLAQAFDIDVL